jgi:nicotinamide-nucleotide amidase
MRLEEQIRDGFTVQKKTLSLAESCTGGAIAARLVSVKDASKYFLGSLVVYSDAWKKQFLQVAAKPISREAAIEMVEGLFARTEADVALAITGDAEPPGIMFVAIGERGKEIKVHQIQAPGPRSAAIEFAVQFTLKELNELLTG